MKKTILALLLITSINTYSQCWEQPTGLNTIDIGSIPPTQVIFAGNYRIVGYGIVKPKFEDWDTLFFDGTMLVDKELRMNNAHIYTAGNINLGKVLMQGNDTINASGELSIYSISGTGLNNVIRLAIGMNSILISSKTYYPGDIINGNIKVIKCDTNILPIVENSLKVIMKPNYDFYTQFRTTSGSNSRQLNVWVTENGKRVLLKVIVPVAGVTEHNTTISLSEIDGALKIKK